MATERQAPDVLISSTGVTGTIADIDEDPDTPDGAWLVATSNNVNTDALVSFPSPTGDPTNGANNQEFKAWVKRNAASGAVDPVFRIDLYENGTLVTSGTDQTVTSNTGELFTFNWNSVNLGTADGSLVEAFLVGTKSGGSPANRSSVDFGAIEWNVQYTAGAPVLITGLVASAIGNTVAGTTTQSSINIAGEIANGVGNSTVGITTQGSITLSNGLSSAISNTIAGTLTLSSMTVTGAIASSIGNSTPTTIVLGLLSLSNGLASSIGNTTVGTVIYGSATITGITASAIANSTVGTIAITDAGVTVSNVTASAISNTIAGTLKFGSLSVSNKVASSVSNSTLGTFIYGSMSISNKVASSIGVSTVQTVKQGSLSISNKVASSIGNSTTGSFLYGSMSITALASTIARSTVGTVTGGGEPIANKRWSQRNQFGLHELNRWNAHGEAINDFNTVRLEE